MKLLHAAVLTVFIPATTAVADEAGKSKIQETQILIAEIGKALDLYYVDCNTYPVDLKYVTTPPPDCGNWGPDPYIKEIHNDPWGRPLKYLRRDPQSYELKSLGADGVEGGTGDNMDVVSH